MSSCAKADRIFGGAVLALANHNQFPLNEAWQQVWLTNDVSGYEVTYICT